MVIPHASLPIMSHINSPVGFTMYSVVTVPKPNVTSPVSVSGFEPVTTKVARAPPAKSLPS